MPVEDKSQGNGVPKTELLPEQTARESPRAMGVPYGEWNHAIAVIGSPGSGKTNWATGRALSLACTPAYIIAHDPGWRIPSEVRDGSRVVAKPRILRCMTRADAEASLHADPSAIIALSTPDAADAIRLAMDLGKRSLEIGKGKSGIPVVLYLDEAVASEDASAYRLGDELRALLAQRRHFHVGVIFTCQSPTLMHKQMLLLATEVIVFRTAVTDAESSRLRAVRFSDSEIATINNLRNFQYLRKKM